MIWSSWPLLLLRQPPRISSSSRNNVRNLVFLDKGRLAQSLPGSLSRKRGAFLCFGQNGTSRETWNSLVISPGIDSELTKLGLESSAFQAEPRGCAIGPANLTVALPENAKNPFALLVAEAHAMRFLRGCAQ